jgi:UDP-glucuronate 4-epimerase
MPFSEYDNVDHPVSLYAATKKANELMAYSYSHLYNIPTTGLRFFTVYGPWGRPDMAPILFIKEILKEKNIQVFNNGNMLRDFTYIDDIVEGIYRIMFKPASPDPHYNSQSPNPATSYTTYRIFNIGNNKPIYLLDFIETIETALGKKAIKQMIPLQAGDMHGTHADLRALETYISYRPIINIEEGIKRFVSWYRGFYSI